jgi:hypothetical protein
MKTMRKFILLAVLATIVLLLLVEFGPAVVFGGEPAASSHVRAGTR